MLKCLIFAVYVCEEMLSAFGEVEDSLEIDNFRTGGSNGGKKAREELQIVQVERYRHILRFSNIRHF